MLIFALCLTICFAALSSTGAQKNSPNCRAVNVTEGDFEAQNKQLSREMMGPRSIRYMSHAYYGPIMEYDMTPSEFPLYHRRYLPHVLPCLQPGAVIYVKTEWLPQFIDLFYDQIMVPFVLMSGGSDLPSPSGAALAKFNDADSKILHWYTINCHQNPNPSRFTCVPLGVLDNNVWNKPHPDMYSIIKSNYSSFNPIVNGDVHKTTHKLVVKNDTYEVLVPQFNMGTHPVRTHIWSMLCLPAPDASGSSYLHKNSNNVTALCSGRVPLRAMVTSTIKSKFVVSPHGMGLDCHRTWETLYLGAYPIVQKSSLDEMYTDLPVLIVDKWTDITLDMLSAAYEKFISTAYTFDTVRMSYWHKKLHSHSNNVYMRYDLVDAELPKLQAVQNLQLKEGDLIMGQNKLVYVIRNNTKCAVPSLEVFTSYPGWDFGDVKHLRDVIISDIYDGPEVVKYAPPLPPP